MAGSSILTVDNLLVLGMVGGVGAYFLDIPAGFKSDVDHFIYDLTHGGNTGPGPGTECDPACPSGQVCQNGQCVPDDGNTLPTGDCNSFGGDCDQACDHGCQGANCVACLSACGKSCADTKTTSSCDYTCSHGFCTSWRDKGCSGSCSQCSKNAPSGYPGPYGVSEYPVDYYDPYASRYWTMQPDAYPLEGPLLRDYY